VRIPGNELHHRHIGRYGGGNVDLEPGTIEPGCPYYYKATYVDKTLASGDDSMLSFQLAYGLTIHDALFRMEEYGEGMDEALRTAFASRLGPEHYDEALKDLRSVIERGGILTMLHVVSVETELTMPLYEDEEFGPISFGGRLDWIGVSDDPDELWFDDYKTDRRPPSYADAYAWRQGMGYGLLLRENAEQMGLERDVVKIRGLYDAVKHYALPIEYTNDQLDVYAAWLESVARTILRDEKGKARLNPGCGFCPLKETCPAWAQLPGTGNALYERMISKDFAERIRQREKAREVANRLYALTKEIEKAMKEKILVDGPIVVDSEEWYLDQGQTALVDARQLHELMGDAFYDVAKPGVTAVRAWAKEHLEYGPDIERIVVKVPSKNRTLKSRVAKSDE